MKRKLIYVFTSLVMAGSIIFPSMAVVHAEDSTSNTGSSTTSSGTSGSSDSSDTTKVETENHTMTDRIAKFKANFKVKLGAAETARLKLKCVGAQSAVGTLNTKFSNSVTVRTKAYDELTKNLDKLVTKLKAKNVDTTTLESQITELKTKITTYNNDLTAYKQSLSDLKAVDCKADPDGFQAALLAARSAHEKLVTDVTAIKTYLTGTIKPTLQTIRQQLESKESSSSNSSSNGGSN